MPAPYRLWFEEATADDAPHARFRTRGRGYRLLLGADGATLKLGRSATSTEKKIELRLAGSRSTPAIEGLDPLPARVYDATFSARGSLAGRSTFGRVKYSGVYPGIDVVYYGNDDQLEFDFVVAANADPSPIRLEVSGADAVAIEDAGDLLLTVAGKSVRVKKAVAYQEIGGRRVIVDAHYVKAGAASVRFELGKFDRSQPLTIDPIVLFSTYFGGAGVEGPRELSVNSFGEVYLFSSTDDSITVPRTTTDPMQTPQPGWNECVLSKYASDGATLLYAVLLQGATCQAMDAGHYGQVHIAAGAGFEHHVRTIYEANNSVSIDLLNRAYDFTAGPVEFMRADANGAVYLLVVRDNPATPGLYMHELQKVSDAGQLVGQATVLVPAFTPAPGGGHQTSENVSGLDVDNQGFAYVVGVGTADGRITPTANAVQPTRPNGPGETYGFLLAVDTVNGFQIDYASYIGGANDDFLNGIAVDRDSGHVFLTGGTNSPDFPSTSGLPGYAGFGDYAAFVTKLDLSQFGANQRVYSRVLGTGYSQANAIALLPGGIAAIAGQAYDANNLFPLFDPLYAGDFRNAQRPFLSVFTANGANLLLSTFLNQATGFDSYAGYIATGPNNSVHVASITNETGLATTGGPQPSPGGSYDSLIQSFIINTGSTNSEPVVTITPDVLTLPRTGVSGGLFELRCGGLFTCSVTDPNGDAIVEYLWVGPNGLRVNGGATPGSAQITLAPGTHVFTLFARDAHGAIGGHELEVTVPESNTEVGQNVTVQLTDERFVTPGRRYYGNVHPATITFSQVTTAGLSLLTSRSDLAPAPPSGWQAGSPALYFDVQSSAALNGPFTVCFDTTGMSFADPAGIVLYKDVGGTWVPMDSQSVGAGSICGETTDVGNFFGTFAIFYPQVPATAIRTIAGNGSAEGADGSGFQNAVLPTSSTLTRPSYMAFDAPRRRLYVTELSQFAGVRRIDLHSSQTETAVWPEPGLGSGPIAVDPSGRYLYYVRQFQANGSDEIVRYDLDQQTTTVVAGGGSGSPTNGGLATDGSFSITALAVDPLGYVYFAGSGVVARIDASGAMQWILSYNTQPVPGVLSTGYFDNPRTLAFDAANHLLVGGQTLIRVSPGGNGAIDGDGSESFDVIGGQTGEQLASYITPYAGDGGHPRDAAMAISYQMIVASDGAVLFTDGILHSIRRIAPGADGIVNGDLGETIGTVAGFFSSTAPVDSGFATSQAMDPRGLVEDAATGQFLVASHSWNRLFSFGLSPLLTGQPALEADLELQLVIVDPGNNSHTELSLSNGDLAHFAFFVANRGSGGTVGAAVLTSTLDPRLTHTQVLSHPYCNPVNQVVTCPVPYLGPGEWTFVHASAVIASNAAGPGETVTMTRQGHVDYAADSFPANNTSNVVTLLVTEGTPTADLGVDAQVRAATSSFADQATVPNSGTVHLRFVVSNHGNAASGPLTLTDPLGNMTFAPAQSDARCVDGGGTLTCTLNALQPGQSATVDVAAVVGALATPANPFTFQNTVFVSTPGERNALNNTDAVTVHVVAGDPPNLAATKYLLSGGVPQVQLTASVGSTVGYRLGATNIGSGATTGPITIVDQLANGLTFVPAQSDARCAAVAQTVTCVSNTSLAPNAAVTFDIAVQIAPNLIPLLTTTQISNTITVATAGDADPDNNFAFPVELTVEHPDTTAPVVTAPAPITIAAIMAGGTHGNAPSAPASVALAAFIDGATAVDDDIDFPLPMSTYLVPCANPSAQPGSHDSVGTGSLFPVGTSCVRFQFIDRAGNVGTAFSSVTVLAPVGGQVAGENQPTQATDANNVPQPVTVTFFPDASAGLVQANPIAPTAPANFTIVGQAFEITTTVQYTGAIRVCITGAFVAGDTIYHNGQPVSTTVSNGVACATVLSLSPFMVLRAVPLQTPVGANITVQPPNLLDQLQPLTVTFETVTAGGFTTAVAIVPPPAVPSGLELISNAYNISTTATYSGTVTVCFQGPFASFDVVYQNGVALPTTVVPGFTACANVTSLSGLMVLRSPHAELHIIASAPASVPLGGTVRYTLTIINGGPAVATGVVVTMPVPPGVLVNPTGWPGPCNLPIVGAPSELSCAIVSPILIRGEVVVTLDVTPTAVGILTGTFAVSSALPDPDSSNNVATATTIVTAAADIEVTAVPSAVNLVPGAPVTYTMTIRNNGPSVATNVEALVEPLAGFVMDEAAFPISCAVQGNAFCHFGDLNPQQTVSLTVSGHVAGPTSAMARFSAWSDEPDPVPANNAATAAVTVNRPPVVDAGPDREVFLFTPTGIQLSGSATDPDGDAITIYQWFEGGTLLGNGSDAAVSLSFGTHVLTLVATDARFAQGSDTVTITVRPTVLAKPVHVTANSYSAEHVRVAWSPVPGATQYRVYRDVNQVTQLQGPPTDIREVLLPNAVLVATVPATETELFQDALPTLVRQFYAVQAVDGATVSDPAGAPEVLVQAAPNAEIFGFADMHSHQMANLAFGRHLIWGNAFSPAGIHDAMPRCDAAHGPGGLAAPVETFLSESLGHNTSGADPGAHSQFVGWPRFNSYTHQQQYYESVKRAFDGGQRLMVMHAESNELLCMVTPRDPAFNCSDMVTVEAQLQEAKNLEAFVDGQAGGEGRGWYQIAYSGEEARHIINSGKMAVVLGIEVDTLFDCGLNDTCTIDDLRTKLNHFQALGVRHVFPVGHFDNAFGGAALYHPLFTFGNRETTNTWFTPRDCSAAGYRYAPSTGFDTAIFVALQMLIHHNPFPSFPPDPSFAGDCNNRGLTSLGAFLVRELIARHMIIDIDHMSELTANSVLAIAEEEDYPAIVSGHSGPLAITRGMRASEGAKSTSQLTRLNALGGVAAVILHQGERATASQPNGTAQHASVAVLNDCGSSSKTFAQSYMTAVDIMGGPSVAAVGLGSDFNGFGGQPGPRFGTGACPGDAAPAPQNNGVGYPFNIVARPGVNAGRLHMSDSPPRVDSDVRSPWDFNFDGLAHAGLLPDFIQDLRNVGISDAYLQPLFRSAEAYVQMWQRAEGSDTPFEAGTLLVTGINTTFFATNTAGEPEPVTVTFGEIQTEGFLVAEPMDNPPPPPDEHMFIGQVFDLFTTSTVAPPIVVCIQGAFAAGDRIVHFDGDLWTDITQSDGNHLNSICGHTTSFSPFGVMRAIGTAADTDPPQVTVSAAPGTLWPADASMRNVTLTGNISDTGSGLDHATFTVLDEYGAVQPTGPVVINADGSYSVSLSLEASRRPADTDGRHYTIRVAAVDRSGNSGSASAIALVPYFVDNDLHGRVVGEGRLGNGSTYYDFSAQAKEISATSQFGYFNVKRVTTTATDRFLSTAVTGIAFAVGSGSFIDSVAYIGTGTWNGQAGYRFEAFVVDRGNPGPGMDEVRFTVFNQSGTVVATFSGLLTKGNISSATYQQ